MFYGGADFISGGDTQRCYIWPYKSNIRYKYNCKYKYNYKYKSVRRE